MAIAEILRAIGPAASIIFAAWIFMGFLQQRYDAAVERYRSLIMEYRAEGASEQRRVNVRDQIVVYRKRCALMNWASLIGLVAAILLILTLIAAELSMLGWKFFAYVSAGMAMGGFGLVIGAALLVIIEGIIIHRQLDSELLDMPSLADGTGQAPGGIADENRPGHRRKPRSLL